MSEARAKAELHLASLRNEAARLGKLFLELGQALEADPLNIQTREGFFLTRRHGARVNCEDLDAAMLSTLIRAIRIAKADVDRLK